MAQTTSYLQFNSLTRVENIKIDTSITTVPTLKEVKRDRENMRSTTVLHNNFDRRLDANYYAPDLVTAGARYAIYKKTPSQYYYDYVCTLENGEVSCIDYNIQNNEFYKYLACIEKLSSDGSVEYLMYENRNELTGETYFTQAQWNDWSICNINESDNPGIYYKNGNVWKLGLNIEGEDLVHNRNVVNWDTLGKYPKVSIGEKSYDTGVFTGLLGSMKEYTLYTYDNDTYKFTSKLVYEYTEKIYVENPYAREVEKMKAWREFCDDGNLKLLKDVKGNSWIVQIVESPQRSINLPSNYMQNTITFSWMEVEDVNNVSIVSNLESISNSII